MDKEKQTPKVAINTDPKQFPPEEADFQERMDGFNKELVTILAKYELALGALPKVLNDGRLAADPLLVSTRQIRKEAEAKESAKTPPAAKVEGGLENPDA